MTVNTRVVSDRDRAGGAALTGREGPACTFQENSGIYDFFEAQARVSPEHAALVFREEECTYLELSRKAERLAARLSRFCSAPDTVIAICVERSLEMMVGLLGILKAGAAYLPLDPSFPAGRLEYMLQDSGARALITEARLLERFRSAPDEVILLDPGWEQGTAAEPAAANRAGAGGRNLAYVMYTSGSTGRPKGVMIERRQVANFFAAMDRLLGVGSGVWLAVTSISFDISVLELFWTLARGFTVILQPEGDMFAPGSRHSFESQIERRRVTHLQCTPSLARLLASNPGAFAALGKVRTLLLGGEALPAALVEKLRGSFHGELFNMYGPTETTVWSTAYQVRGGELAIPIGTPLANTATLILDEDLHLVPDGRRGELLIGGAGVVRGYNNRPELTAERFVLNPAGEGGRFYRTGDLVRRRPDGNLEFLGRVDHQIKILGHRIEPEEIEAVLGRHPSVSAAAVIAVEDVPGEKKLIAYVVMEAGRTATAGDLRAYLQQTLPPHMLPAVFTFLQSMPSTPNGKIDRRALPALRASAPDRGGEPKTQGEIELRLIELWRESLQDADVDADRNFFDMGATSMDVAEVAMSLSHLLGREVAITELFEYPTVRALSAHLQPDGVREQAQPGAERGQSRREAVASLRRRHAEQ